jgi:hypothetical protein
MLDIYVPHLMSRKSPILIFFYGVNFAKGDKIDPLIQDGLLYHNVGAFFAARGITTIIPDYRRVNSEFGGEDAAFPSGGEDVSLVMRWLEGFDYKGSGNAFIMGNYVGGVHVSSFILGPQYLEQRKTLAAGGNGIIFKGGIELSVPFHFKAVSPGHADSLKNYYGSVEQIRKKCPLGLLEAARKTGMSREDMAIPKVLLLTGEFDNENEIAQPVRDFADLRAEIWGSGVELKIIEGHDHISAVVALMSADAAGEKWGEDVADWIWTLNK